MSRAAVNNERRIGLRRRDLGRGHTVTSPEHEATMPAPGVVSITRPTGILLSPEGTE